jgi:hypothetical protein
LSNTGKKGAQRIEQRDIASLRPHANNPRKHSNKQLKQIQASIRRFGFTNPVLVDEKNSIIAGHGRVEAAKSLGLANVPVIVLSGLSVAVPRLLQSSRQTRTSILSSRVSMAGNWKLCWRLSTPGAAPRMSFPMWIRQRRFRVAVTCGCSASTA